jgi:hypothetical protein
MKRSPTDFGSPARVSTDWTQLLDVEDWREIAGVLDLSPGQAQFLWNALQDPRDGFIARRMKLSPHGAHAHRRAVFRKLGVDSMAAAIARIFATHLHLHRRKTGEVADLSK